MDAPGHADGGDEFRDGRDRRMMDGDDRATGDDKDIFARGDWIDPVDPAVIDDYDAGRDRLAVVYETDTGAIPELALEPSETAGNLWITLDGTRMAEVVGAGDLRAEDVLLVTPAEFAGL